MAVRVIATVILLAMLLSGQKEVLGRWGIFMLLLPTAWFIFVALSPKFNTIRFAGLIWTAAMVIFLLPSAIFYPF